MDQLTTLQVPNSSRFHLLDPLRGIAAIAVFLCHHQYSETFQLLCPNIYSVFKLGGHAVPVFFVISGYCIALTANRVMAKNQTSRYFLWKRMYRIYPTFWCSILLILAIRAFSMTLIEGGLVNQHPFLGNSMKMPGYSEGAWIGIVTLTRSITHHHGVWWGRFGEVNGAYWTLALEMQFYIIVALMLRFRRFYSAGLITMTALSFVVYCYQPLYVRFAFWGTSIPYWSWFSYGLGLYWLQNRNWTPQRIFQSYAVPVCSIIGTTYLVGIIYCGVSGLGIEGQYFAFSSAVFLWGLLAIDDQFSNLKQSSHRLLRWITRGSTALGAASYTIYLMHNEVSHLLDLCLYRLIPEHAVVREGCILGGTVVIAYYCYYLIEKPFLTRRQKAIYHSEQETILPMHQPGFEIPETERKVA